MWTINNDSNIKVYELVNLFELGKNKLWDDIEIYDSVGVKLVKNDSDQIINAVQSIRMQLTSTLIDDWMCTRRILCVDIDLIR